MIRALLAVIIAALSSPCLAENYRVNWGLEQYSSCTNQNFSIQLKGTNPNVLVTRIIGTISGNPNFGAVDTTVTRAALVAIFNPTLTWADPAAAAVTATPPGTNHGVANGLGAFIVKQTGAQAVQVPVDLKFDPPVLLPGGALWLSTQVQSYGPGLPDPNQCLDVEAQLLVQFQD